AVVQAQYKAEVDQAQAQSAQVGPLTQAKAQLDVIAAQANLANRQAELRQRQLVAEVVRPAEAEADKVRILAQADAERSRIQAGAAAWRGRVGLARMVIDRVPRIVREAANGLAGANVNVLNGAEGLGELTAGLVAQGLTILDSVKRNLAASPTARAGADPDADDGDGGGGPARPRGVLGRQRARQTR